MAKIPVPILVVSRGLPVLSLAAGQEVSWDPEPFCLLLAVGIRAVCFKIAGKKLWMDSKCAYKVK